MFVSKYVRAFARNVSAVLYSGFCTFCCVGVALSQGGDLHVTRPQHLVYHIQQQAIEGAIHRPGDVYIDHAGKPNIVLLDEVPHTDVTTFQEANTSLETSQYNPYDFDGDCIPDSLETTCLLYTSPSPRDATLSRMPSSA